MWSLGVVLYEMCALKRPFELEAGEGFAEMREKILEHDYDSIPEQYSKELKELVLSLLEKDPSKRPTINQILQHPLVMKRLNFVLNSNQFKEEFLKSMKINPNFISAYAEPPESIEGENSYKIEQYEKHLEPIDYELKNDKFSPIQHKKEDLETFKTVYNNFIKTINPYRLRSARVKNLFQKKIVPKLEDEDPLVAIEETNENNDTEDQEEETK